MMKVSFKQNMGSLDRIIRVFIGAVLLILGVLGGEGAMILIIISIPLLLTGITGICPTYAFLGITTKRIETS